MRQCIILNMLALTFVCAFVTPAMADGKLSWKGSGSGDWNGQRTHLDELGLTFWWLQDVTGQQNVSGGISKGGAAQWRSMLEVNYQFEPLTPLKGSEIQVSAGWNVGTNAQDFVGSLLSSTGIWRETAIRLYELYWGQFFADKQVHFKIGRLGLCPFEAAYTAMFAAGDISNGYYCNPGGLYLNQPVTSLVYPIATWGARIKIAPKKQDFQFWLGVYNGSESENLPNADEHGVNFKMNLRESTYVQGEFWYKLNQDPEDGGLPGNYKIGGMYDSGSFARLDDATQTQRGNPGWYVIGDQMLFRERPPATPTDPAKLKAGWRMSHPTDQGLYATANFVMNPKTAINIAPYWVSAGLSYKGAIPHRDADITSFAFYYASLSTDSTLDYEFQLRFFYTLQLTQWFFMSPHVHYFKKPGGGVSRMPSCLVRGFTSPFDSSPRSASVRFVGLSTGEMTMRRFKSSSALITVVMGALILQACGTTEKESPGTPEPGTAKSEPVSFTRDIKPIFDTKCVGCHACYDSPGQLDLRSVDGIVRGAMKVDTYAARGKPIEPTFVWNSPNTLADWREMGFFSVIEGGRDSIMGKMLALGHANPVEPNAQFPADIKIDQLERKNYLANTYEIDGYAEQYPKEGMPLAVSGLSEEEYTATMSWLENGAAIDYEAPEPTANELAEIQKWEEFLNAHDKRSKLVARYIFEHLFLVNFLFEDRDDANSFILVRSTTPSGEETVPVYQHLPNGEVDGEFYYRFMLLELTDCVKNTRLQMLASDEKLDRWKNMFFEEDWSVDRLPRYTDAERFNPLGTFSAIPPKARWRFTLDTNWLQNGSIVHGPSCHGNMAVGTVQERWWMLFERPETSIYVNDPEYRAAIDPLAALQHNPDNLLDAVLAQREYLERRKEAIKRAFARAKKTDHRARLTDIWRGEYPDDTPFLTVIRHDDNGYAVEGSAAVGDFPKTAWVADLPLMEHAVYSAYINFDIFEDTITQIFASRQIFGLSRVSNELNFLRFLPVKVRRPLFESWYQGQQGEAVRSALVPHLQPDQDVPTDIKYKTDDPKREFFEKALDYLGTRVNADDPINRPKLGDDADRITKALISIVAASREQEPTWRKFKTLLPEAVFLRVDGAGREPVIYTMTHERDYATKGFISMDLQEDIPSKATVMILEGAYTAYPNFIFRIDEDEIEEFASTLIDAETQTDLTAIVERWGIRRSSPDFWPVLDSVTAYVERTDPRRAGTFDINRYKNL